MVKESNHKILLEIVQRLSTIEADIKHISRHIEVINKEHGEVCNRLEAIEKRNLGVDISWKALCKIGASAVTLVTIISVILKIVELI